MRPCFCTKGSFKKHMKTVENLKQSYVLTPVGARDAYLVMIVKNFVEKLPLGLIVIFAKTCKSVQLLSMTLTKSGFPAEALHSGRLQKERMAALSTFRSCQVKIFLLINTFLFSQELLYR